MPMSRPTGRCRRRSATAWNSRRPPLTPKAWHQRFGNPRKAATLAARRSAGISRSISASMPAFGICLTIRRAGRWCGNSVRSSTIGASRSIRSRAITMPRRVMRHRAQASPPTGGFANGSIQWARTPPQLSSTRTGGPVRRNRHGSYHGVDGVPEGASYWYFVDDEPKAQRFERYLEQNPGAVDLWLGGHTQTFPDDVVSGRGHVERKWGTNFVNCAQLSKYHSFVTCPPMSRHFTFTVGSPLVRVRCYLHDDTHAPKGWYAPAERVLELGRLVGAHGGRGGAAAREAGPRLGT